MVGFIVQMEGFSVDYKKAKLYSTKVVAAIINKTVQGEVRSTKKMEINQNNYHQDIRHISKSGLDLIATCPKKYWYKYLSNQSKDFDNSAFKIGRAFHRACTEPETFSDNYIVSRTKIDRRTKKGKEKFADLMHLAKGREILQTEESMTSKEKTKHLSYDQIMFMRDSVFAHPIANYLLKEGTAEKIYTWPWLPHPNDSAKTLYKFDYKPDDQIGVFEKQPITRNEAGFNNKLFMPARRARHFVLIMSVWAERITHISEESAINEGFENKEQFFDTFNKINPKVDIQSAYNWVYQYKLINPKESDKIKIDHGIK